MTPLTTTPLTWDAPSEQRSKGDSTGAPGMQ